LEVIVIILAMIAAAFVSEDLTLIATALLIRDMHIPWSVGIVGAILAIFIGDVALWALGRFVGRRALAFAWVARRLPEERLERASRWFERNGLTAMILARFVPGSRLPMYFASGVIGKNSFKVISWTFIAALVWAPLFVVVVALVGPSFIEPLQQYLGGGWILLAVAAIAAYVVIRLAFRLSSPRGRHKIRVFFARIYRWEFWPAWLFYLPILPYLAWLCIRHRGLTTVTAANPGIPESGIVDESKADILAHLPADAVLPFFLIPAGEIENRIAHFQSEFTTRSFSFPLILKPDNGYRGASVKLIRDVAGVQHYLAQHAGDVLAQQYHPGPFEAGIFYVRLPSENRGRIFSITDKQFPVISGDGVRTLEQLIYNHPRFFMQAETFLKRHAAQRNTILSAGETLRLAIAGNHCQGTLFKDGAHLITPQLEMRIDEISQHFAGFYFGRFDIRYSNPADLAAGRDIAIIELNGVTSESTNLYDPGWSLLRAYRTLAAQWKLAFQIGSQNRKRGTPTVPLRKLIRMIRNHYKHTRPDPLSD
jgi:membrane protein DedA with SNARE-associated domain